MYYNIIVYVVHIILDEAFDAPVVFRASVVVVATEVP